MLLRTQKVLAQMKAEAKYLPLKEIAAEVGVTLHGLKSYPRVHDLLLQVRHGNRWQFRGIPTVHCDCDVDDPLLT
jgi:hypothetical protein